MTDGIGDYFRAAARHAKHWRTRQRMRPGAKLTSATCKSCGRPIEYRRGRDGLPFMAEPGDAGSVHVCLAPAEERTP